MPLKHRLVLALVVVLLLGAILASPLLVADGVRAWIWWAARREKLTVKIDKVDAPFLRPVVFHNFSLTSAPNAAYRIDLRATTMSVQLNFQRILLRMRGHLLRNVAINDLHLQIHRNDNGEALPDSTWATWQRLLPDSANIERFDLRIENDPVVALVRGGSLVFSEIEAGRFTANEITIASPLVRQTFAPIRAGVRWEDQHLTLAGLSLTRGLDLQSATFDFSRLNNQQVGVEFYLDVFGGSIRGNVADDWRSDSSAWTLAASAANVSLAQTAEAVGLADRVTGLMHAGKFIFRGDARNPKNTTASIWAELAAPAWRDRKADVIMLGASFYNRKIDIQQVYIKQRANELTLNGEAPWPEKWSDWLGADFHGTVTASLNDLGDFANLLGANREQFRGKVAVDGAIEAHARKISGNVAANGKSLMLFGSPVDRFDLQLNIADGVADIAQFNFQRAQDFLRVEGKIDMFGAQGLRGTVELNAKNLAIYLPKFSPALPAKGRFDFTGKSGTFDGFTIGTADSLVALDGDIDFSQPQKIDIKMRPATLVEANVDQADCIDRVEVAPRAKETAPLPRLNQLNIHTDRTSGASDMTLQTEAGEKNYRLGCADGTERALQLTVPAK